MVRDDIIVLYSAVEEDIGFRRRKDGATGDMRGTMLSDTANNDKKYKLFKYSSVPLLMG